MLLGLGECSLLVFPVFWAWRNMTQFETDAVYVNEETQQLSKPDHCSFDGRLFLTSVLPQRKGLASSRAPSANTHSGLEPCLRQCHLCEQVAVVPSPPRRSSPVPSEPPPPRRCSWPGHRVFAGDTALPGLRPFFGTRHALYSQTPARGETPPETNYPSTVCLSLARTPKTEPEP